MAKLRRTLFVLAFCVVLTAGFAMSAAAEEVLTVWAWSTAAYGLEEIVPAFEAAHPGVKVEVHDIAWEEMHNKRSLFWLPELVPQMSPPLKETWLSSM